MNRTNITLNLDWLQLTLIGKIMTKEWDEVYNEIGNGFMLKALGYGTKHFKYQYEVWYNGVIFGNLRTEPRCIGTLNPLWQSFKLANARLYEIGVLSKTQLFLKTIGSEVRNVSRMDIACDGFGYMRIVNLCVQKVIKKKGKAKLKVYFDNDINPEGFDVGSKNSDKWITGYKKAKYIEKDNKFYIKEFWKKSGLTKYDSKNVERLELKLKNDAIGKIKDFDWTRLEEVEYLAGIMKIQMENMFEFVKPGYSNISYAKKIEFINWSNVKAEKLEFKAAKETTEINRMKQTAKTLFFLHLGTQKEYHLQQCWEIVANINCIEWFQDKAAFWEIEFERKNIKRRFEYIPFWRQINANEQLMLTEANTIFS